MVLSAFEHICTFIPTELITYFKYSIEKYLKYLYIYIGIHLPKNCSHK